MFVFFNNTLNIWAQTLILELDEAIVNTLIKFKYRSGSSKNVFEKLTEFLVYSLENKTTSYLEVKF